MKITISHITPLPSDVERDDYFLKCTTDNGSTVLFWGGYESNSRNIDSLIKQEAPVTVEILDPDEVNTCEDQDENRAYWFSKQKASMSVPECVALIIYPNDES